MLPWQIILFQLMFILFQVMELMAPSEMGQMN